jgi:hypothetical protein
MKPRILVMLAAALSIGGAAMGQQQRDLQFFRPYDQRGINVFETGKQDTVELKISG